MWEREDLLPVQIKMVWQDGSTVSTLADVSCKLRSVMNALQRWSRDKFGSVNKELKEIRNKLEELNMYAVTH